MHTVRSDTIHAIRRFNRFYTQKIGVLQEGLLHSPFSLTEVRVLYELANRKNPTASDIMKDLDLDRGYLSRILSRFYRRGYITRKRSELDRRSAHLCLTPKGRKVFEPLDRRSNEKVAGLISELSQQDRLKLVRAMDAVESLLAPRPYDDRSYTLRSHRPGDMGWVIHRHGALYSQEYGWDERFEALVAEIAAKFIQNFDSRRERCWIAERRGEIAGSVFLVKHTDEVAKLRLLLVEPSARGLGIGKRLVQECIRFARHAGYRKITLWTNDILHAARHIYEQAGFHLVKEEPHDLFGEGLVAQTWDLEL